MSTSSQTNRHVQRSVTYSQIMTRFHDLKASLVRAHKHVHTNPRKCKEEMRKLDLEIDRIFVQLKQLAVFDGTLTKDERTDTYIAT
jgi:hypothetical protein